jgi:hypothetical protein
MVPGKETLNRTAEVHIISEYLTCPALESLAYRRLECRPRDDLTLTTCPICESRRAKRSCPGLPASPWSGKGERICAQCCGTEREVRIDCPPTCSYLIAARRYEAEHPEARRYAAAGAGRKTSTELPFSDVRLEEDFLAEQQPFIGQLAVTIVRQAQQQPKLTDPEILAAVDRLAQAYHTLASGLYYEQPPEGAWARELYAALKTLIEHHQQEHSALPALSVVEGSVVEGSLTKGSGASMRPGDILKALVFLLRIGRMRANGRPLSRAFLDFLRAQLPAEAQPKPDSRIILPGA